MLRSVPKAEVRFGLDWTIASLEMSAAAFSEKYDVPYFEFEEEGLSLGLGFVVETEQGFQFGLRTFVHGAPQYLEVVVNEMSVTPREDLQAALTALGIEESDLAWISEDVVRNCNPWLAGRGPVT